MVQRPVPKGKSSRAVEPSGTTVNPPRSDNSNGSCSLLSESQEQKNRPVIPQALLKNFNVLVLDRRSNVNQAYLVTETHPQPQLINPYEYLEAVEGFSPRTQGSPRAGCHALPYESPQKKRRDSQSPPPPCKRRRSCAQPQASADVDEDSDYVSDPEDELDGVMDDGELCEMRAIEVSRLKIEYFPIAFKMVGQLNCKDVGKAWIKWCHPRKQTTHPYNGGSTKTDSLIRYGYEGGFTLPSYWPSHFGWQQGEGCRHKEPDHIKKPERLILLKHLLCCGHKQFPIDKLQESTEQICRRLPKNFTKNSVAVLRQIYAARRMEIRYEQGEIDGDTKVWVHMPKPLGKAQQGAKATKPICIKDEHPSKQVKPSEAVRAPTANMAVDAHTGEEDPVTAQMNLDSDDDKIESIMPESTILTPSNEGFGGASIQPSQSNSQPTKPTVETTETTSFVPLQRKRSRPRISASHSQQRSLSQATAKKFGGLPFESMPQLPQKRASTSHAGANASYSTPMSREQGSSLFHHGVNTQRLSLTESQVFNEALLLHNGHREIRVPHRPRQDPEVPCSNPMFSLSPPRRPVVPNPTAFSGSSSGLAGLPSDNSWQDTNNLWNARQSGSYGSIYDVGVDTGANLPCLPSDVTSSFGSDYSDSSFGNGFETHNWGEATQPRVSGDQQASDEELRQRFPTYLSSGFNALSVDPGPQGYNPLFPPNFSIGMEHQFNPFG